MIALIMKKIIVLMSVVFFMSFIHVYAETGCCLNPNSDVCSFMDSSECCPPDNNSYAIQPPHNESECLNRYFFPGNEDACLKLDNGACTLGCCCKQIVNDSGVFYKFQADYKLNCEGGEWITGTCSEDACEKAYTAKKKNETCNITIDNCKKNIEFPLRCVPVYAGDVFAGEDVCCNEYECAAKYPVNLSGNIIYVDSCFLPGSYQPSSVSLNHNSSFRCYFGVWYDENKSLGKGELCQDVDIKNTSLYYSQIGVCNNKTCKVTLIRKLGKCNESICKESINDARYKVCCDADECAYFSKTPQCFKHGENITVNISGSVLKEQCLNGTWKLINKTKGRRNFQCSNDSDCADGFKCIHFTAKSHPELDNYFEKSFCCNASTDCAYSSGCEAKDKTVFVSGIKFKCVPSSWEEVVPESPQDNEGSGGGGCSHGSHGGGGAPPSSGDNNLLNLGQGQPCQPGQCASNLKCMEFKLPEKKEDEKNDERQSEKKLHPECSGGVCTEQPENPSKNDNSEENKIMRCCNDTQCPYEGGCKNIGETIKVDDVEYICVSPDWETKAPGEIKCEEDQCKTDDGCISQGEFWFKIMPEDADVEIKSNTDAAKAIAAKEIESVVKYECTANGLVERQRWPEERKGCSFVPGFSEGNDIILLLIPALGLFLFLKNRFSNLFYAEN